MGRSGVWLRRVFAAVAAASFVLLLSTAWLWYRSWRFADGHFGIDVLLTPLGADPTWGFSSQVGRLVLSRSVGDRGFENGQALEILRLPGFALDEFRGAKGSWLFLTTSHRAVVLLTSILPAIWVFVRLRIRRKSRLLAFPVNVSPRNMSPAVSEAADLRT